MTDIQELADTLQRIEAKIDALDLRLSDLQAAIEDAALAISHLDATIEELT